MAIKVYQMAEFRGDEEDEVATATVYRSNTPDIDMVDLFSGSRARAESLLSNLKQWEVQNDVTVLPVLGSGSVWLGLGQTLSFIGRVRLSELS